MEQYLRLNEEFGVYVSAEEGYGDLWAKDLEEGIAQNEMKMAEARAEMEMQKEKSENFSTIVMIIAIGVVIVKILSFFAKCSSKGNVGCMESGNINDDMNQYMLNELHRQNREMNQFMLEENNRQIDEFSRKCVTPFEHGGFDMHNGNSFNMDFGHGPGMF